MIPLFLVRIILGAPVGLSIIVCVPTSRPAATSASNFARNLISDMALDIASCILFRCCAGDIKLVQLATLFAELNDLLSKHEATHGSRPPLILCGDFNSTPDSPLIHFVRSGSLFYQGTQETQASF